MKIECTKKHPEVRYFFSGLVDPSTNKLASTAYFAIVSSVFCMNGQWACIDQNQFFLNLWCNFPLVDLTMGGIDHRGNCPWVELSTGGIFRT